MSYSIRTKDGIVINNIPDSVDRDSPELKARVAKIRAELGMSSPSLKNAMVSSPKADTPQGDFPISTANVMGAVIEPVMQAASGIAGQAAAGYEAIPQFIRGEPNLRNTVEQRVESLTYEPRTVGGQMASQKIGELANKYLGPEGLDILNLGPEMGQQAFERTGSPLLGAVYETLPTALEAATGVRALTGGPVRLKNPDGSPTTELVRVLGAKGIDFNALTPATLDAIPEFSPASTLRSGVADINPKRVAGKDIEAGGTQEGLARYQPDVFRGVKIDPVAKAAIDFDIDEGVVQMIKQSDPVTRFNMLRVVDAHKTKTVNRASDADPYAIVGDSLASRVNYLDRQAANAALKLNSIVKGRMSGQDVDTARIQDMYVRALDDLGVSYKVNEYGSPLFVNNKGQSALDFSKSRVAEDPASQKMIEAATRLVANRATPDAASLHLLKQQLDALIDWNKADKGGVIPPTGRNFVKELRFTANDILRNIDAEYGKVNDTLSLVLDAKGNLYDSLVKSARELAKEGEWAAAGNDLRKLFTNYGKGYEQIEALKSIDAAVNKLQSQATGKDVALPDASATSQVSQKVDKSNLFNLGELVLELDRVIQPSKRANFQSKIAAGNEPLLREIRELGSRQGMIDSALGLVKKPFEKDPKIAERERKFNTYAALQKLIAARGKE